MDYLISYLQLGGCYLVIFLLVCLIDAFIINDVNHTVHMIIKRPYQDYRDLQKILGITVCQVILWPLALIIDFFIILFLSCSWWEDRKQPRRR